MKRKSFHTKRLIVFSLAIMLVVIALILFFNMKFYYNQINESMMITMESEKVRQSDEQKVYSLYEKMVYGSAEYVLDYSCFYLKENGYGSKALEELGSRIPVNLYLVAKDGKITKSSESRGLNLTRDQIDELCETGYYEEINSEGLFYRYMSAPLNDGHVVISYRAVDIEDAGVMINPSTVSETGANIVWLDKDGIVVVSSSDSFVGRQIPLDNFEDGSSSSGRIRLSNYGECLYAYEKIGDNILVVWKPFSTVYIDMLRSSVVPSILFLVVLGTMLIYVIKLAGMNLSEDEISSDRIIILKNGKALDRQIISHVTSLGIFGLLLMTLSIFYIRTLLSYSDQNIDATENLKRLSASYTTNLTNAETEMKDLEVEFGDYAEMISWGYMNHPDKLDSESLIRLRDRMRMIDRIIVTNAQGTVVASTTNEVGYTLGKTGDDALYRNVLDNGYDIFFVPIEPDDENCYKTTIVVRRQDTQGIIIVDMDIDYAAGFMNVWNLKQTMLEADMGAADVFVYDNDIPEVIYKLDSKTNSLDVIDATIPEELALNGYAGVSRIRGVKYYVNTHVDTDNNLTFISALPIKNIPFMLAWSVFGVCVAGMLLFEHLLISDVAVIEITSDEAWGGLSDTHRDNRISLRSQFMNDGFKSVIIRMLMAAGGLLVLLLLIDYIIASESLIVYLFSSKWSKGVNLFSITMILIIIVGSFLLAYLLNRFILLICNNLGPRGMTVGHLMNSLLKFIIFLVAIILSLKELGCNLSALLAGAGIAGAAISLCANSTINDLLSGFFIVFEGAFQIGDWVKVGDWRGEVMDIGMRTTKVAYADIYKIFNNSAMTNVSVMDWTNSGAIARIDVAYGENINNVIKLIEDNKQRYIDEIPPMEDGPYVKGVVDLTDSGVTIEMFAFGDQKYIAAIERHLRRVTKNLFDENGVEIPFNQVTIHYEDNE